MDQDFELGTRHEDSAAVLAVATDSRGAQAQPEPESSRKTARPYNFRKPDRLSKDQMRTLRLLHESFAKQASLSLSAHLRTSVQLDVDSVDQGVYGEYLSDLNSATFLHVVGMDPLLGSALVGIDLAVLMAAVDRLLGGPGLAPRELRTPTEIELALVRTVVTGILKSLASAWNRALELRPSIRDVVADQRDVQIALRGDPVVVITLKVQMLECTGAITFCLPHVLIEPALPKLSAQTWFASDVPGGENSASQLRQNLDFATVEVAVELGGAWVTMSELKDIKEGDVIVLDKSSDQPLDFMVGGKPKFRCRPGMVGSKLAVQVLGRLDQLEAEGTRQAKQGSTVQRDDVVRAAG